MIIKTIAAAVAVALGVTLGSSVATVTPAEAHTTVKVFVGGKWVWKRHRHHHCGYVWTKHRHHRHGKWHKHRVWVCR